MTKKTNESKPRLRPLSQADLLVVTGGGPSRPKPGQYSSGSGGGGGTF
jgi:hypothetical protein